MHGDDFTVRGWKDWLNWFLEKINERQKCKHRGRMGAGKDDLKSIRILKRIVT